MKPDLLDRKILNIIQNHFPVTSRPYKEIACSLSLTEEEVLARIARLKKLEIIKDIRGIFDYRKLGYCGTLCGASVEEAKVNQAANFINAYPGVTHNYLRNHYFNVWFTLIAPSKEVSQSIIREIQHLEEIQDLLVLPALQLFKIKVDFHFDEVEK